MSLDSNREKIAKIYTRLRKRTKDNEKKIGNNFENLGEQVYYKLKEKIIFRDIKPGERIIDREFAEEFGVSRSIVRQSLNILEKKGLVNSYPRSGYYVKEIKRKDIEDIFDLRYLLEKFATRQAVLKLNQNKIDRLEEIFEEAWDDLKEGSSVKLLEADAFLHWVLIDNCGNEKVKEVIEDINAFVLFYRVSDVIYEERAKPVYKMHYRIFEAIKNKEVEKAERLMARHIKESKKTILKNYEKYTFGDLEKA